MTKRFLRYSGLGLAVLTLGAIAACGSSDSPSSPSSAAGSTSAGAHAGGAGGLSAGAGTPGTAGSSTAGSGTGGSSTAGAAGTGTGGAGSGFTCAGTKPASATITEFADLVANPTSAGNYTFLLGVPGGTFTYQPGALTLATTGMALNIKGNIKAYDGFGVYLTSCTDGSAYSGVSFNIKGTAGATGKLNFRVQTNSDTAIDATNMKGSCAVPAGTTDTYPLCHPSGIDIPVSVGGGTVMVNFSQLTGGVPVDAVTGNDIVGLEWAFNWTPAPAGGAGGAGGAAGASGAGGAAGGATVAGAYDADITIDDIKFIGGSMAGAGGAGGAATGGAAGAAGASAGAGGSAGAKGGAGGSAGN